MEIIQEPFPHVIFSLSKAEYQEIQLAWPFEFIESKSSLKGNAIGVEFSWKARLAGELSSLFGVGGSPTLGRFMLRKPGYALPPHIDPPGLNLTIIHYLPFDGQGEEAGTVLYTSSKIPKWKKGKSTVYLKEQDCIPSLVVPFRAGTGLAFPNTQKAIHGVPEIKEERRLYQWHLRD